LSLPSFSKLTIICGVILVLISGAGCKIAPEESIPIDDNLNNSPPSLTNAAIDSGWQDQPHGIHYWDPQLSCWRMNYYIWPIDASNHSHGYYSWYVFYAELPSINLDRENWAEPSLEYHSPNVEVYYDQKDTVCTNCFDFHCRWDPISRWGQAASGYRFMSVSNNQLTGQAALVVDFRVPNKPGEESKPMSPPPVPVDTTEYPTVNSHIIKPGADLTGADLSYANLPGVNLENASLHQADLTETDLSGANLRNATLDEAISRRANLSNVKARLITGNAAVLIQADLTGAELILSSFYEANLYQAKLIDADLRQANLNYSRLINADLTRANLADADLTGTNLTGADLTGANLTGADLTGANLHGAELEGADLTSAIFDNTIMPDGSIRNR
jgi:uncharacterized protein YjbI with pentapeptide repeats